MGGGYFIRCEWDQEGGDYGSICVMYLPFPYPLTLLSRLCSQDIDANSYNERGKATPLIHALKCLSGRPAVLLLHVKFLVEEMGANVDNLRDNPLDRNSVLPSPLVQSAQCGDLAVVKYLVSRGADVNRQATKEEVTPLYTAAAHGRPNVVEYLLDECSADANITSSANFTPLFIGCAIGDVGVVRLLCRPGLPIKSNPSPLAGACIGGHLEVVNFLADEMLVDFDELSDFN